MKTITSALATAVLGLGSLGVAEAQTGYSTICGPAGCTTVPTYGYGYAKPVSTLPAYSSQKTICGPSGCYQVPTYKPPVYQPALPVRHDTRFDSRRDDYSGSRWNDKFDGRGKGMFGEDRHDRFDNHRYLNASNPHQNRR